MVIGTAWRRWVAGSGLSALAVLDAAVLRLGAPNPGSLSRGLAHPHRWVMEYGPDGVALRLAGAALWLAAGWLAVGLAAGLLAGVPGRCAPAARRLSAAMLPPLLRRLTAATLGAAVVLTGATATAQTVHRGGGSVAVAATPWPTTPGAARRAVPWPTTPGPKRPSAGAVVVVTSGDSLWRIAARRLGPTATTAQIDAEWRRWYLANAERIGPDPDLIHPGLRLYAPRAEETP